MQPSSQAGSSSAAVSSGETPRSVAIVRLPSAATSETTVPVRPATFGPTDLDAVALERPRRDPARLVVRELADEASLTAELRDPGGDVRGLPAGAELRDRVRVGPFRERLAEPDDHVQEQVADGHDHAYDPSMDGESRRSRTRSFLVGAAVGASAAIAAARRLRPKERRRETPAGLAAFEEAPCYRELVEREREAP